jgi:hypothetical protein
MKKFRQAIEPFFLRPYTSGKTRFPLKRFPISETQLPVGINLCKRDRWRDEKIPDAITIAIVKS